MQFNVEWLKKWVAVDLSAGEIAAKLAETLGKTIKTPVDLVALAFAGLRLAGLGGMTTRGFGRVEMEPIQNA